MKRTGPTNQHSKTLIVALKKLSASQKVNLWKAIALELQASTRNRREVSVADIAKHAKAGETVIVPGKVLSDGDIKIKVTVAAFKFSQSAANKINATGKAISIEELMKINPKAQKVRILG